MSYLYWDVGDEPSIEERIDFAYTQEGRAIFEELAMLDDALTLCPTNNCDSPGLSAEPAAAHEGLARGGFVGLDFEELVESGDFEDLLDVGGDAAEFQVDLELLALLLDLDQLAEHRGGHELDAAEIEDHAFFGGVVELFDEVLAELLELGFVGQPGVAKMDRPDAVFGVAGDGHGLARGRSGIPHTLHETEVQGQ